MYQIENVVASEIYNTYTCCVIDYFSKEDIVLQLNYEDEKYAREEIKGKSVGMWKIKKLK